MAFLDGVIKNWAVWTSIIALVFTMGVSYSSLADCNKRISQLELCADNMEITMSDYKMQFAIMNVKLERISLDIQDIKLSLKEHIKNNTVSNY